jgi:hypothetical protein
MVDSHQRHAANVAARSKASPADHGRPRANIRPFNDMERDQQLAGSRGWLRVDWSDLLQY